MTTLEGLMGVDPTSPDIVRAEQLADNDHALLRELVQIRKSRSLSQAAVGGLMGISQPSVAAFEAHDSNPTLATIRRYAHAVRALIVHKVERDEGQLLDASLRDQWVTTNIQDVEVSALAEIAHPTEFVIRVEVSGAAPFQLGGAQPRRVDLALAA